MGVLDVVRSSHERRAHSTPACNIAILLRESLDSSARRTLSGRYSDTTSDACRDAPNAFDSTWLRLRRLRLRPVTAAPPGAAATERQAAERQASGKRQPHPAAASTGGSRNRAASGRAASERQAA